MRRLASLFLALALLLAVAPSAAAARKAGDRNRNAIPDRWERAHRLPLAKDHSRRDSDRDGLSAWAEWRSRTNPRKRDSDRDRRPDGREDGDRDKLANADEVRFGLDPGKRDSDGDGVRDGDENAGVIRSVAGPVVTIALARGGTLVAAIGEGSDLGCDGDADAARPGEEEEDFVLEDDEPVEEDEEELAEELAFAGEEDGEELGEPLVVDGAGAADPPADDAGEIAEEIVDPVEPDPCLPAVRAGALVRSAEVERDGATLVLVALELLAD